MYADTEEVAAWVRGELDRERIFVLGHSWGTYLGLRLALFADYGADVGVSISGMPGPPFGPS